MKHYTSTKLYLSIYQPSTVLAGRINDPHPSTGMTEIAYDWMDGDSTYVKSGQIMYVGTTFGGRDRGKVRVRSATYQVITVAQNSDILWADNLYITIVNYHPIFPIYQKAQEIGNTPQTADILVWKDEDIEYVNQNDYPGSLICMGSHRAAMLENGSNTQYWSATGTVNTNGNSLSYEWEFEGGTPDTSTSQTPGAVTYNTAGHYVTSLSVTSSSGTVDTSYRYVSIYDAAHPPVEKWGMKDLRGSRSEGGYNTSLWIKEPLVNIIPGALIVIFFRQLQSSHWRE